MKKPIVIILIGTLFVLLGGLLIAWKFNAAPERAAYDKAKTAIDEPNKTHVLSIYGKGSASAINSWYINFFDSMSPSKGKVIVVENGSITRSHAAEGSRSFDDAMSFDPTLSKVTAETAMKTAKSYAEKNQISYDETTALLRRTEAGVAPTWSVGLRQGGVSKGYVLANGADGAFASYAPPKEKYTATDFGADVKDTFKGIGADLEEFFTGERTVDK